MRITGADDDRLVMHLALLAVSMLVFTSLPASSAGNQTGPPVLNWAFLAGNPILLLPLLTLAITGGIWRAAAREPLGRSVAVQYGPPPDLSPAEASALLNDSVKGCAIISTIVDLAVRGYLSIEQPADGDQGGKNEYVFHNLRKPNWATDLAQHERDLMEHIFEYGEQPSLATLWHGLPEYRTQIKENIFRSLATKKMYRLNPIWSGTILMTAGFAVLLALWFVATALDVNLTQYSILNPVCFALAMLAIFFFSRKITLKSALGTERWREVKGFQEFMGRVEGDRLKSMSPDLFEKFLPYAIALGVESQWTATFKGMLTRPLSWYTGAVTDFIMALEG